MERSERILDHWFGPIDEAGRFEPSRLDYWFGKSELVDEELRRLFLADHERAAAGLLDDWARAPRGRLALVILLDQLPRNLNRGTAAAFAHDGKALSLAREGVALGHDRALRLVERSFLYLPFEHAEDRDAQAEAVRLYGQLVTAAPPDQRRTYETFLDYAVRHQVIVDRFGRFPHRNAILGRESTPEETAFLQEPGSSF